MWSSSVGAPLFAPEASRHGDDPRGTRDGRGNLSSSHPVIHNTNKAIFQSPPQNAGFSDSVCRSPSKFPDRLQHLDNERADLPSPGVEPYWGSYPLNLVNEPNSTGLDTVAEILIVCSYRSGPTSKPSKQTGVNSVWSYMSAARSNGSLLDTHM